MTTPASSPIRLHEDQQLFRGLLFSTARATNFPPRLIEKDYYCTVLLEYLAAVPSLVFKGGTCLAKVHASFYRLSEDLDYSVPLAHTATRNQRRHAAEPFKNAISALPARLTAFQLIQECKGANNSMQYAALVGYPSSAGGTTDTIKIEVGLREPLLLPSINGMARTLLLDPVTGQALLDPVTVTCLSLRETYSEKFRAALSRREAAIRDFYDLDHAVRQLSLDFAADELIQLIRAKLSIPGNDPVDVSAARLQVLRGQVQTQLRPVLREAEFRDFDLDRAFSLVAAMAERVK